MADGIAPTFDKVGPTAPGAPPSEARAPAPPDGLSGAEPNFKPTSAPSGPSIPGLTATAPAPDSVPKPPVAAPADAVPSKGGAPTMEEKKLEHSSGGAGPALSAPKPVEVMSVPDTPINGSTPAGGTPRPELNIPTEKVQIPKSSDAPTSEAKESTGPAVHTGVQEPTHTPVVSLSKEDSIPEPIKDHPSGQGLNGKPAGEPAEMTGAIQTHDESTSAEPSSLKRKLEDEKSTEKVNGGAVPQSEPRPAEKKAKLDEGVAAPVKADTSSQPQANSKPEANSTSTTTQTSSENKTPEKANGRAKRGMGKRAKKIAEAIVGKTARKTRSQGPA